MLAVGNEFSVLRTVVGISVLVLFARLFAGLMARFKLPEIVGEILAGVVLGPYAIGGIIILFGKPLIELNSLFLAFAAIGGIIVLLYAGLEFTLKDLVNAGLPAFAIALFGVVVPFVLGYYATVFFGLGGQSALIVGATLTATSIAVTVSVLKELGIGRTNEAKMMISAAVVDDILGLVVLSVVVAVIQSNSAPSVLSVAGTAVDSFLVWAIALFGAVLLVPRALSLLGRSKTDGTVEAGMTGITFGLSAFVGIFGLSPMIGSFIAGMASSESAYRNRIKEFVSELRLIFGPLFFAVIGTYLNISELSFADTGLVAVLIIVAVAAKYIGCGLPASIFLKDAKKGSRVGYGMISRGEVGFIVIGIALTSQAISESTYSVLLLVLIATTVLSPIMLKRAYIGEKRRIFAS